MYLAVEFRDVLSFLSSGPENVKRLFDLVKLVHQSQNSYLYWRSDFPKYCYDLINYNDEQIYGDWADGVNPTLTNLKNQN